MAFLYHGQQNEQGRSALTGRTGRTGVTRKTQNGHPWSKLANYGRYGFLRLKRYFRTIVDVIRKMLIHTGVVIKEL